ncbi:FHA domain-containing protein [Nocardioides panacisoli]
MSSRMPLCPAGHNSTADDYCDVCGLPIPAGGTPPATPDVPQPPAPADTPPAPSDSGPESSACPNCHATNPPNALFCEACGYDFTTGSLPRPIQPSSLDLGTPPAPGVDDPPTTEREALPGDIAQEPPASIAPPLQDSWVAEVWIDPDWYADQDSTDPLPSAGVPTVVPLRSTSILVGRTSASRNIHPDIDLGTDSGISRRHCQLTTDGSRWWVEDLGSSNGTYVGATGAALPEQPVPPGEKREIGPDDRIYLGAWTRIVIRRAAPGELG